MNKFAKKAAVLGLAGVMCFSTLTGCGNKLDPDAVVATVGEEEVLLGTANFFARLQQASYETYYAGMMGTTSDEMWNQADESGVTFDVTIKDGIMENLTTMYVLRQHAKDYNVSITDEEKTAIEQAAKDFLSSNNEEVLGEVSADEETIVELLELMTIQYKMNEPLMKEAEELAETAKETTTEDTKEETAEEPKDGEEDVTSDVETQAAIDYQYNEIISKWKKDLKIDVDKELWNKIDFKKKGYTMKQQEENK